MTDDDPPQGGYRIGERVSLDADGGSWDGTVVDIVADPVIPTFRVYWRSPHDALVSDHFHDELIAHDRRRDPQPRITCPLCHRTSYNPNDVRWGYCGNCHAYTGVPNPLMQGHR